MEEKKNNVASKAFKRELYVSFCIYYFPVMILMCMVVLNVDYLKSNISVTFPLLCVLFPAIVSIAMAFIRVKIVWGLEYKPNWKNFTLFLAVISIMLLIEKISYSILEQPDLTNIGIFIAVLLISLVLYKFSNEKVDYKTVAKMLLTVSVIFMFVWFVFAVIVRTIYSMIVLLSWVLLFFFSLHTVLKGGE